MIKDVLVCGINTESNQKISKASAIFAIKNKNKKKKALRKTLILISCLIVKEPVNKKVYRFKRLSTVQLDIAKDAMMI